MSGAVKEDSENLDLMKIPNDFMQEINEILRQESMDTVVTFLRLPEPPSIHDEKALMQMYRLLRIQSENLPPVMYVHGIKTVVSASL